MAFMILCGVMILFGVAMVIVLGNDSFWEKEAK